MAIPQHFDDVYQTHVMCVQQCVRARLRILGSPRRWADALCARRGTLACRPQRRVSRRVERRNRHAKCTRLGRRESRQIFAPHARASRPTIENAQVKNYEDLLTDPFTGERRWIITVYTPRNCAQILSASQAKVGVLPILFD
jgi:hypothetical protein